MNVHVSLAYDTDQRLQSWALTQEQKAEFDMLVKLLELGMISELTFVSRAQRCITFTAERPLKKEP